MKLNKGMENTTDNSLKEHEDAMIALVVDFGRIIGLQKSVCEIYGLLFASLKELSMEQISSRLKMSLGSTSQGLKMLKDLGGVKVVSLPGERKDHFQAEFNFRKIITKFLSDEMLPQLERTDSSLRELDQLLATLDSPNQSEMVKRVNLIRKVNSRAKGIIPAVSKILSL